VGQLHDDGQQQRREEETSEVRCCEFVCVCARAVLIQVGVVYTKHYQLAVAWQVGT
jgi:hypothetical protein